MAAVQIFLSQCRIKAHRDVGCFHEKESQEPVALLADPAHPLLSSGGVLARDQSQVAGGIAKDRKGLLFRTTRGCSGELPLNALLQSDVRRMIRRRALAARIKTEIGCHTREAVSDIVLVNRMLGYGCTKNSDMEGAEAAAPGGSDKPSPSMMVRSMLSC